MEDPHLRHLRELIRDLKSRLDAFAEYHPDLLHGGIHLELTAFDNDRTSATASYAVGGARPSKMERTGIILSKLSSAVAELEELQGSQAGITQVRGMIANFVAIFEGREPPYDNSVP